MNLSSHAQAVLLLTICLGESGPDRVRPLSRGEWGRFAIWLRDNDMDPSGLLRGDTHRLLAGLVDGTVSAHRVQSLLNRGVAFGLCLEKWERAGLWVVTRSDPDYPVRLKRRLGHECPAFLFGCGDRALLNGGGLAVVGARDAGAEDLAFAADLGRRAALRGRSIVSGGARGTDRGAMRGALQGEGAAIGVMADSLLAASISRGCRKAIMSGRLTLVSPFNPESGFSVGKAMARNKYIFCLADAAVIVASGNAKGGTWHGAVEAINAGWVPVWVRESIDPDSGNGRLVEMGAIPFAGCDVAPVEKSMTQVEF